MSIENTEYLRERTGPRPGDPLYLHLADLLLCLSEDASTRDAIDILDYGCGGSPYRTLFPNARYVRADVAETANIDFEIGPDGLIAAKPGSFDLVLSTQVLEHVPNVTGYLQSCFDLLRPGGKLVLSTHGIFEDHSCPDDFYRWTADGLRKDIASVGFEIQSARKLTTQGRALAFLLRTKLHLLARHKRDGFGILFRALNRILIRMSRAFDSWCDFRLSRFRAVDAGEPGHTIYIALLVVARKPAA